MPSRKTAAKSDESESQPLMSTVRSETAAQEAEPAEPAVPPIEAAKAVRAEERLTPDGKAESVTGREELFTNLEGVGESGTQANEAGDQNSDLNPIGRRSA